jgi:hypothetical protein
MTDITEKFIKFPFIPLNFQLQLENKLDNLTTAIRKIKKLKDSNQSKIIYNPITCDLEITCTIGDSMCRLTTSTIPNSSQIKIYYYSHGIPTGYEVQYFNPKQLSGHLQYHLLTSEDLKQQGEFEQQKQEREDALEKAHDSSPQTCGGIDKCKHCQGERSYDETSAHQHLGGYT